MWTLSYLTATTSYPASIKWILGCCGDCIFERKQAVASCRKCTFLCSVSLCQQCYDGMRIRLLVSSRMKCGGRSMSDQATTDFDSSRDSRSLKSLLRVTVIVLQIFNTFETVI